MLPSLECELFIVGVEGRLLAETELVAIAIDKLEQGFKVYIRTA